MGFDTRVLTGVGVLADRRGAGAPASYPHFACLEVELESWAPEDCPMCAAGGRPEAHRSSRCGPIQTDGPQRPPGGTQFPG